MCDNNDIILKRIEELISKLNELEKENEELKSEIRRYQGAEARRALLGRN